MLLGIDSCGTTGSIALARWDGETASIITQSELAGKTFSAQLIPKIRELLSERAATPRDLQAIVVVNGPGSFTGVRIGVSAAKGLAEALQIPVVALSRLMLLASKAETQIAALDAGRREYYFGSYKFEKPEEMLLTADEIREYYNMPIAICESELVENLPSAKLVSPPDAAEALLAATARLRANDYDNIAILDGNYVRRTPAELFAKPAAGRK
jgi:tRNA threonylcarbamoyladenosine biosynthesis protein TsaB